jgi:hypothetical protein
LPPADDKIGYFAVSRQSLKIIAAGVWYGGGLALLIKGSRLLMAAEVLYSDHYLTWLTPGIGLLIGVLKAQFLFQTSCQKNLDRINNLEKPKVWQFYRLRFLVFLVLMILVGAALSKQAQGNFSFLISVAIVDFSLAFALMVSGRRFWQRHQD